jgi:hypothetical protein
LDSLTALRAMEEQARLSPDELRQLEVLQEQLKKEAVLLRRALGW